MIKINALAQLVLRRFFVVQASFFSNYAAFPKR